MSADAIRPVLQAIVLAERVYTDVSGKKIIAGTFNGFETKTIAVPHVENPDGSKTMRVPGGTDPGCPSLYISLTDVESGTELSIQFVNVKENKIVFQMSVRIEQSDRLSTVELIAPLPPISTFARVAGVFSFDVAWNGEILGSLRITVKARD